ncbi:diacylglycerol kinase [Sphingomonas sp. AR_OL41]|jgi:diacylglycerol kinase (ATP)|uniref:diacylglycerol kinase n=1 Tax=Sphingomonas sp. AR_OL41 TaxID=3042729 RepID=UPI0024802AD3|nr:diacylglycerol kinase [Sphingomonas sp. AR_OL41]MDH7971355.1 diacylglycerol kinase [Sphingomonas sp. AR_OL41]
MKNSPFRARFAFAVTGIVTVWQRERSFRTHVRAAALTVAFLLALRPGWLWTALLLSSAVLVMALEMANAALEYLADQVHPDIAPGIAAAKDAAAGAVLIASGGALVTAMLMLGDLAYRCFS